MLYNLIPYFLMKAATLQLWGRDARFETSLQKEIWQMLNILELSEHTFQKLFLLTSTQSMVLNAVTAFGYNKEDNMVCNIILI